MGSSLNKGTLIMMHYSLFYSLINPIIYNQPDYLISDDLKSAILRHFFYPDRPGQQTPGTNKVTYPRFFGTYIQTEETVSSHPGKRL